MNFSIDNLPTREAEVVRHIRQGLSNQDIAALMGIKLSTVKTYVKRLYTHFEVSNRIQLLRKAGYLVNAEQITRKIGNWQETDR